MFKVNHWQTSPPTLTIVSGIVAVIILGISTYYLLKLRGPFRWQRLEPPPGEVIQLLGGDEGVVYVETADGLRYMLSSSDWEQSYGQQYVGDSRSPSDCDVYTTPKPPDHVVQSIVDCSYEVEIDRQDNYLLLEDGSVWHWWHFSTYMDGIPYMIYGAGLLLGVLLFLVSAIAWWRAAKQAA